MSTPHELMMQRIANNLSKLRTAEEAERGAPFFVNGEHYYLSTSCFHGLHSHCRSAVNIDDEDKIPGTCKYCPAKCICVCHHPPEPEPVIVSSIID